MTSKFNFILSLLFIAVSCQAQKIVQKPSDARKLQEKESVFVLKSFKQLLDTVKPEIGYVYGNPEYPYGGAIKMFFFTKEEYRQQKKIKKEPIAVLVMFMPEKNPGLRKIIPKGGIDMSKKELIKEYGDMIVRSIYVTGKD